MGGNYSYLPSVQAANCFFCLTFRVPDRIKVIDCDSSTLEVIRRAIARGYRLNLRTEYDKYGAWGFVLAGSPFRSGSSKEEAVAGKQVACTILQDLYQRGWRAVLSTELCRSKDLSSWFFEQVEQPQYDSTVCCLSLSGTDRLQFVNFPKRLTGVVVDAVRRKWSLGIQEELKELKDSGHELKLNGNPWSASGIKATRSSSEREEVEARQMLLEIVRCMARESYELYLTSDIKDTTDSLFFRLSQETERLAVGADSFALSLNQQDRIRLIDAPEEVQQVVRQVTKKRWQPGVAKDREYHGCHELKLNGSPWWATGMDSLQPRLLVSLLLQELRSLGWRVLETVQVCRRLNDKAVFLFVRSEPEISLHWCLSLNEASVLRFINAPMEVVDALRLVIAGNYIHGIKTEKIYAGYHQVRLHGRPWSCSSGNDHVHGRHLMLGILEAMHQRGWAVVCSADVSATYHHSDSGQDYPLDVHSWWFSAKAPGEHQPKYQPTAVGQPNGNAADSEEPETRQTKVEIVD